ncbi:MAG: Gfo/Idh/MocA family oxidoreductase [Candidatus Omnitrophica bacterium]|nr:Gfo/Idh/MocA family oxidoreductase [Candidatus Omnitrophota bacterium]MCM8788982.1 Gfo/Idh/MocA family oxidoreductase [Candidatus Omnitrophota bacterium]
MSEIKIGIIGFDTSHVPAFTKIINDPSDPFHVPGGKVIAGVPTFSKDLDLSYNRVETYKRELVEIYNVKLFDSIEDMLEDVNAILLESVDGRRHLKEAEPVIKARKPVFIDKPFTANYEDAAKIVQLAEKYRCPVFSCSSLRFDVNISKLRNDIEVGRILGCDAFGPESRLDVMPGFFWYGIHGIEILFSVMKTGCKSVEVINTESSDIAVGVWNDGRTGIFRGIKQGHPSYGMTIFGEKKVKHTTYNPDIPTYSMLIKEIMKFFRSGIAPYSIEETLEIVAFMEASLISEKEKRPVNLMEIMG